MHNYRQALHGSFMSTTIIKGFQDGPVQNTDPRSSRIGFKSLRVQIPRRKSSRTSFPILDESIKREMKSGQTRLKRQFSVIETPSISTPYFANMSAPLDGVPLRADIARAKSLSSKAEARTSRSSGDISVNAETQRPNSVVHCRSQSEPINYSQVRPEEFRKLVYSKLRIDRSSIALDWFD